MYIYIYISQQQIHKRCVSWLLGAMTRPSTSATSGAFHAPHLRHLLPGAFLHLLQICQLFVPGVAGSCPNGSHRKGTAHLRLDMAPRMEQVESKKVPYNK